MTEPIADAVLDEVMMLGIELAAVAKPRDPGKFVELLQRFTHAILREAFEHQDEIRARLGMPRPVVTAADVERAGASDDEHAGPTRGAQCPFCNAQILGPMTEHHCARKRELGFSSTGAAGAGSSADHRHETAASDAPAAPSTKSALPAAERLSSAPSTVAAEEGAGSATGGAEPLAEPAPQAEGAPRGALSGDGAGAPPAGVSAGAEASRPAVDWRGKPTGKPAVSRGGLTDAQCKQLCREYLDARDANNNQTPPGWAKKKAAELGVKIGAIYSAVYPAQLSLMTDKIAGNSPPPSPKREPGERPLQRSADEPPDLVHTETPACWCRRKPVSRDNVWCKLRKFQKPASQHAALRTEQPRAERYKVRRVEGTRY